MPRALFASRPAFSVPATLLALLGAASFTALAPAPAQVSVETGPPPPAALGVFENQADIGGVLHPGDAHYDPGTAAYTVSGSGGNMWFDHDEFHFVWKQVSAENLSLGATIQILGEGGNAHRKAVLMIRQSLAPDSPYVDAARHGEGLTSLQFRETPGAITHEIESNVSGPARLEIEKLGDRFYLWVGDSPSALQFAGGAAHVAIRAPFYVGIGVCAHDANAVEKASFTELELNPAPVQKKENFSTLESVLQSGDARTGFVSRDRLTDAGWSADGLFLTYHHRGATGQTAFSPLRTATPVGPAVVPAAQPNTYFTATRGGSVQIWRKDASGGEPEAITTEGEFSNAEPRLSPDGKSLLFLSVPGSLAKLPASGEMTLRMMTLADRKIRTLATFHGDKGSLGEQPWSPDGKRVAFISYQTLASGASAR